MDSTDVEETQSSENINIPEGWTTDEKYDLLQILKMFGSNNIESFAQFLPSKSLAEINQVLEYYKIKALNHPAIADKKNKEKNIVEAIPRVPLAAWTKFLTQSLSYKELQTETASALRLISEFECLPNSTMCTNNVDFPMIYNIVADALEGKPIPDDKCVTSILEKCIIETAYTSKAFIRNSALQTIINSINMSEKEITEFPRPTRDAELTTIRHLASQRSYNPLNIQENYLKPSMHS